METVLALAQLLALLSVSVLCIYLVVTLRQIRHDLAEFAQRVKPVLENLTYITERLKSAAAKIDEQADIIKGSLQSFKTVADNVVLFERRIRQQLEEPIMQVSSIIGAIVGSVIEFFGRFRG
ncbi:MAG: hypothetical protein V1799_19590 [bacterium]